MSSRHSRLAIEQAGGDDEAEAASEAELDALAEASFADEKGLRKRQLKAQGEMLEVQQETLEVVKVLARKVGDLEASEEKSRKVLKLIHDRCDKGANKAEHTERRLRPGPPGFDRKIFFKGESCGCRPGCRTGCVPVVHTRAAAWLASYLATHLAI